MVPEEVVSSERAQADSVFHEIDANFSALAFSLLSSEPSFPQTSSSLPYLSLSDFSSSSREAILMFLFSNSIDASAKMRRNCSFSARSRSSNTSS